MSPSPSRKSELPAEVPVEPAADPALSSAPRPPSPPLPARSTPPTRFLRLPVLGERELAAMSPAPRAAYHAEKAHQDAWGHLPPQVSVHLRGVSLPPQAVENHAKDAKTDPVHFAAARAFYRWPLGLEMSREQYDAAVARVMSEPHGL